MASLKNKLLFRGYLGAVYISVSGFFLCLITFYPGWLSPDSISQFQDAVTANYGNWHPPLMAWWWNKLFIFGVGPEPMLIQSLLFYWAGFSLFSIGFSRYIGRVAFFIPIAGFWPGLLMVLGNIWKDVVFSTSVFLVLSVLFCIDAFNKRTDFLHKILLVFLFTLAVGVKPNGIVVVPFVLFYWCYIEQKQHINKLWASTVSLLGSALIFVFSIFPQLFMKIRDVPSTQYLQGFDIIGVSVRSGTNYLPAYFEAKLDAAGVNWKTQYDVVSANQFFWPNAGIDSISSDIAELSSLSHAWIEAIINEPFAYISHRWEHFLVMLGIGFPQQNFVSMRGVVENPFGIKFNPNKLSDLLFNISDAHPLWFFSGWVYMVIMAVSTIYLFRTFPAMRLFIFSGTAGATVFVLAHFFIGPAPDFRYFYYSYVWTVLISVMSITSGLKRLIDFVKSSNVFQYKLRS